jgi:hypothetical protein
VKLIALVERCQGVGVVLVFTVGKGISITRLKLFRVEWRAVFGTTRAIVCASVCMTSFFHYSDVVNCVDKLHGIQRALACVGTIL